MCDYCTCICVYILHCKSDFICNNFILVSYLCSHFILVCIILMFLHFSISGGPNKYINYVAIQSVYDVFYVCVFIYLMCLLLQCCRTNISVYIIFHIDCNWNKYTCNWVNYKHRGVEICQRNWQIRTPGVGFCWLLMYRGYESVSVTDRFVPPGLVSVGRNCSRAHIKGRGCVSVWQILTPLKIKGKIKEGGANLSGVRICCYTGIGTTAPTGLLGAPDITPSKAHGFALSPSDRGNHSSYHTTARTDKGTRHCHRDCPRDTFTYHETWKESGTWHMARTPENCPRSGYAQQDKTSGTWETRGRAGTGCPRSLASISWHNGEHSGTHQRVKVVWRSEKRTQRVTTCDSFSWGRTDSDTAPASSGWADDTASGHVLHPSTSRCWWREGELSPSEYGNAGANPSTGSITCGAASWGPRIPDDTGNQTHSIQHHAPHQDWHVGPVGFPPTMGRGDASPRWHVNKSGR